MHLAAARERGNEPAPASNNSSSKSGKKKSSWNGDEISAGFVFEYITATVEGVQSDQHFADQQHGRHS